MARSPREGLGRSTDRGKASLGGGRFGETLASWMEAEGFETGEPASPISDLERVRAVLISAAREGRAMSYSDLLGQLGHRFSRPKMRALCKTLDAIDAAGAMRGEPELAVLVVRETDRLPGQGWWVSHAKHRRFEGSWVGPEAAAFVLSIQREAFEFWQASAQPS